MFAEKNLFQKRILKMQHFLCDINRASWLCYLICCPLVSFILDVLSNFKKYIEKDTYRVTSTKSLTGIFARHNLATFYKAEDNALYTISP